MAFTRKFLKSMGIDEEKIDAIMDEHATVVDALKAYKADAEKLPEVQRELEEAKKNDWKEKHDTVKRQFDEYKEEQGKKEAHEAKVRACRALLKSAGIAEKHLDKVLKVYGVDEVELDADGKIKDADKRAEDVKSEFDSFIQTTQTRGAETAKPPANTGGGTMTKKDIMGISDRAERRRAIAENIELFGEQKGDK